MSDGEDETKVLIARDSDHANASFDEYEDINVSDGECKTLTTDQAMETAGFGRFHYLMVIVMGWGNSADAVEMLSISFVMPYAICELHATDLQLGFLTAVGFAGMMIGSYFWGGVSDIKGRIKAMVLCQAFNALFIVGSAFSQSLWFLIAMRLFSGFGAGGTAPLIFVYAVELLPSKNRGRMIGLLSCSYMLGQILVAGMAWFIIPHSEWTTTSNGFTFNSWRIFLLVSALPALSSFILFMFYPESPRYLIGKNKMAEAKSVIRYIYRKNGNTEPYDDNYKIEKHHNSAVNQGGCDIIKEVGRNTYRLVARSDIRPRFIYSCAVVFCLAFSYYGLTMWYPTLLTRMEANNATSLCADVPPSVQTNQTSCDMPDQNVVYFDTFLQAVSSLPGNILYMALVDVIGRKILSGVSMILTAISVFFIWFINSQLGSVIMGCVFAGISVVAWNALSLLTTEIFPTDVRSTARGVQAALFNRVAAILASIIFGALSSTHCEVPILIIACILTVGGILTYKLPDMTNASVN